MKKSLKNFPLSKVTTLKIGGPAQELIAVSNEKQLIETVNYANDRALEFLVIGEGSNLLVSDEGLDKLVIKNEMTGIKKTGQELVVKSGTPLQDLVNFAVKEGLSGIEKMTGIPGTVGGAVYGNAGAYGQTISDYLSEVKFLNTSAAPIRTETVSKADCQFDYRYSHFKKTHYPILEVRFEFKKASSKDLQTIADQILTDRLKKYPPGIKCPGSFFKNILAVNLSKTVLNKIPKDKIPYGKVSVGYLLESVGAKGDRMGDIEIAPYHANLFINRGHGKAADLYNLARKYYLKVKLKFGIEIEPEVQLVNLPPIE